MADAFRLLPTQSGLFEPPPSELFEGLRDAGNYASYNYLRPGLATHFKKHRFDVALELAKDRFGSGGAIDVGCADGVLLPSLAKRFDRVEAIDVNCVLADVASHVVARLGLANTEVFCTRGWTDEQLVERFSGTGLTVAFLLETLEHVGTPGEPLYEPKIKLLKTIFDLLEEGGRIVVSVPKMTGPAFLVKNLVQATLGMHHEEHSLSELLRAGILRDTTSLEKRWDRGHIGFNERILGRSLHRHFRIVRKVNLPFSIVWLLERPGSPKMTTDRGHA